MKRRGVFGALAALGGVAAVAEVKAAPVVPVIPPMLDPVLPVGTILWFQPGAPLPAGWAQMDAPQPPLMNVAHDHFGAGYAVPVHGHSVHDFSVGAHSHSICDLGHSHGIAVVPFVRIIRIA